MQQGYLTKLLELQNELNVPAFIAGDVFDRWDCSPAAINWLLELLCTTGGYPATPNMPNKKRIYTIPGNHDIPHHDYKQLPKSAYWTLVEAGAVKHLSPGMCHEWENVVLTAWPYGFKPERPKKASMTIMVALVHDYVWTKNTGHAEAPPTHRLGSWLDKLKGYDVAFFGDNHKGFLVQSEEVCSVCNTGTFIRRHLDEIDCKPCIGQLHANGTITRHFLDVSKDRFVSMEDEVGQLETAIMADLEAFAEEMNRLHGERMDFGKLVAQWLKKNVVGAGVKKAILRAIGP